MYQHNNIHFTSQYMLQIYESTKKLRIGYYTHDGFFTATAACQRAVMVAKEALEKRGHEVGLRTTTHIEQFTSYQLWQMLYCYILGFISFEANYGKIFWHGDPFVLHIHLTLHTWLLIYVCRTTFIKRTRVPVGGRQF